MKKYFLCVVVMFVYQMTVSQSKIRITYERQSDNSIEFYYEKDVPGTYSVQVTFTKLENSLDDTVYEETVSGDTGSLFTIAPTSPNHRISFSYKWKYRLGIPEPKVDKKVRYLLPFHKNKTIKLHEAYNIEEKHFGNKNLKNWKSFIVYTQKPDTICAMRKGVVVGVVDRYEKDITYNNHIRVKQIKLL